MANPYRTLYRSMARCAGRRPRAVSLGTYNRIRTHSAHPITTTLRNEGVLHAAAPPRFYRLAFRNRRAVSLYRAVNHRAKLLQYSPVWSQYVRFMHPAQG